MGPFIEEVKRKARTDIRYARGMESMQRERYLEYVKDLGAVRERRDYARAHEIIEDLGASARETAHLMHQRRKIYERCVAVGVAPVPPHRVTDGQTARRAPATIVAFRPRRAAIGPEARESPQ